MSILALLFGLKKKVSRRAYLVAGFLLATLKFSVDTAIVYFATGKMWSPLGYIIPSMVLRQEAVGAGPQGMHLLLVACAMPFLWVGLSMSVRRAADAGKSPWLGLLFVLPVVNYITILVLSILPSKTEATWAPSPVVPYRGSGRDAPPESREPLPPGLSAALLGVLASIAVGTAMLSLSIYGLKMYGAALFFATPFTMGASSSVIYNRKHVRTLGQTIGIALAGTALTGGICLLFAMEGVICLLMAFPIAAALSTIGSLVGWAIVTSSRAPIPRAMVLVLPLFALGEAGASAPALRDVTTSIDIDAPPEQVWPNVIGFSELPPPPSWFFKLGIAYPMRARIQGEGVGAVRHCEFSTGPFVEPITVWNPPHHLAFDVTAQPPSMTEWSPYKHVNAPHLEGYMVSRGGEFRLTRLAGGRTRVEGTTHYTLAIYPETYWVAYAEPLLHAIHSRVLTHIKALSESHGGT